MTSAESIDGALRDTARAWVARLASGDLTHEEMATFKGWLVADVSHRAMFDRERKRWRAYEALRPQFDASSASTSRNALSMRRRALPRLAAGLMAACLVLVIVAFDPYIALRADHATSVGEVARVSLPDGSVAELNSDSALAVDFNDHERGVTLLKGEAWFKVVKNPELPFRVHAHDGVTEAVGTAFSVKEEQARVVVSVTEGVVSVIALESNSPERSERVPHGQTTEYSSVTGVSQPAAFDATQALAWRDGRVVIDDLPMSTAITELDRYRPGRILLLDESAANRHVSGIFSIDKIDQGLDGLAKVHGLTVTRLTPYLIVLH